MNCPFCLKEDGQPHEASCPYNSNCLMLTMTVEQYPGYEGRLHCPQCDGHIRGKELGAPDEFSMDGLECNHDLRWMDPNCLTCEIIRNMMGRHLELF